MSEDQNECGITPSLLEEILAAYNNRDIEAAMSYFSEDAIFDTAAGPDIHGTRFEGKAAIRTALQAAFDSVEALHYAPLDTRIAGNKATCEIRRTSTLKSGTQLDFLMVDILTFRDGQLVHKDTYYKQRSG